MVERLDASLGASSVSVNASPPVVVGEAQPLSERDRDPAPVLLIRDATTDTFQDARQPIGVLESLDLDLISKGLMSSSTAFTLLKLYVIYTEAFTVRSLTRIPGSIHITADGLGFQRTCRLPLSYLVSESHRCYSAASFS